MVTINSNQSRADILRAAEPAQRGHSVLAEVESANSTVEAAGSNADEARRTSQERKRSVNSAHETRKGNLVSREVTLQRLNTNQSRNLKKNINQVALLILLAINIAVHLSLTMRHCKFNDYTRPDFFFVEVPGLMVDILNIGLFLYTCKK